MSEYGSNSFSHSYTEGENVKWLNLEAQKKVVMNAEKTLAESISIVIIARNRVQSLARTLKKLMELPEPLPVILVDNHSDDQTVQFVKEHYPQVKLLQLPRNHGSAGRNLGVEYARTPYIAFADDDSWWEAEAFPLAVAYFEQYPQLGLIQGKIIVRGEEIEPACQLMEQSPLTAPPDFPGKYILGFIACGAIVRKDAFLAAGGFHPQLGVGGEEELLALDLAEKGWALAYLPDLVAFHDPSPIRDKTRRKQLIIRNHLWSVWLRRSARGILAETIPLCGKSIADHDIRQGILEACAGLPWVVKERRLMSSALEDEITRLSHMQL
jgi:N-acetylglucosaminyl-diphospho-decaprenol L-rhamnosyltransferase